MGDSYNSGRAFKNIGLNINSENININKIIDLAPEKEFAFVKKEMPNLNYFFSKFHCERGLFPITMEIFQFYFNKLNSNIK